MDYVQTIGSLSGGGSSGGNVSVFNYLDTGGNPATTTFAGVISGSGNLVKSGTGTMLLTGGNTYDLGTIFAGGTLAVSPSENLGDGSFYNGLFFRGGTLRILGSFSTSRRFYMLAPPGGTIDATGNAPTFQLRHRRSPGAATSRLSGGNADLRRRSKAAQVTPGADAHDPNRRDA